MIGLVIATCALIVIAFTAVLNTLLFPRLKPVGASHDSPLVADNHVFISICIPARNEASVIGQSIRNLLAQDFPNFELLILDDNSTDGTAEIARTATNGDTRVRIIAGEPLPDGWLGKNWACHQLSRVARGEWLIFTDADVSWQTGALAALMDEMARTNADLLTVWPTQITETWAERLVVPLIALAIMAYLPIIGVHHTRWPAFAAATGQCLAFRRRAYDAVGGHEAVRGNIVEDVAFARKIKAAGWRLRMADGAGLIACRMYHDWSSVRDGFSKNILAGHANSVLFLAFSFAFHWLVFVMPWLLVYPAWGIPLIILGVGTRMLTATATRQRPLDAFFMPISVVLMSIIALRAVYWQMRYGGPHWKGRVIQRKDAKEQRRKEFIGKFSWLLMCLGCLALCFFL